MKKKIVCTVSTNAAIRPARSLGLLLRIIRGGLLAVVVVGRSGLSLVLRRLVLGRGGLLLVVGGGQVFLAGRLRGIANLEVVVYAGDALDLGDDGLRHIFVGLRGYGAGERDLALDGSGGNQVILEGLRVVEGLNYVHLDLAVATRAGLGSGLGSGLGGLGRVLGGNRSGSEGSSSKDKGRGKRNRFNPLKQSGFHCESVSSHRTGPCVSSLVR